MCMCVCVMVPMWVWQSFTIYVMLHFTTASIFAVSLYKHAVMRGDFCMVTPKQKKKCRFIIEEKK